MNEEMVEVSGEQIGQALVAVNEVLKSLVERVHKLEEYVNELPTPDKTYYKPRGYDDYLNLKQNFDELYRRIGELENGV